MLAKNPAEANAEPTVISVLRGVHDGSAEARRGVLRAAAQRHARTIPSNGALFDCVISMSLGKIRTAPS